jgi:hypothetical protein
VSALPQLSAVSPPTQAQRLRARALTVCSGARRGHIVVLGSARRMASTVMSSVGGRLPMKWCITV